MSIRKLLKTVRVNNNCTQVAMAAMIGISQSYLSRIEAGRVKLTMCVALKLVETYGIPLKTLTPYIKGE